MKCTRNACGLVPSIFRTTGTAICNQAGKQARRTQKKQARWSNRPQGTGDWPHCFGSLALAPLHWNWSLLNISSCLTTDCASLKACCVAWRHVEDAETRSAGPLESMNSGRGTHVGSVFQSRYLAPMMAPHCIPALPGNTRMRHVRAGSAGVSHHRVPMYFAARYLFGLAGCCTLQNPAALGIPCATCAARAGRPRKTPSAPALCCSAFSGCAPDLRPQDLPRRGVGRAADRLLRDPPNLSRFACSGVPSAQATSGNGCPLHTHSLSGPGGPAVRRGTPPRPRPPSRSVTSGRAA